MGKYISFLRENGRWSLFHILEDVNDRRAYTRCGWDYSRDLEIDVVESPETFVICSACVGEKLPEEWEELAREFEFRSGNVQNR